MEHAAGSRSINWLGSSYNILLAADQSHSSLGMFESLNQQGHGPPRHVHHEEDETFYVLSGEVEFWMLGQSHTVRPGETVFIPRGTEHTFRIQGDSPARMLTVMTPGGFECFFAEMETNGLRIPEDMDKVAAVALRYHMTFTGPPLSATTTSSS
jgi:quercetin dioxygenase-like cupin family protein